MLLHDSIVWLSLTQNFSSALTGKQQSVCVRPGRNDDGKTWCRKERVETLYFHVFDVESPCTLFVLRTSAVQGSQSLKKDKKELKSFLAKQTSA